MRRPRLARLPSACLSWVLRLSPWGITMEAIMDWICAGHCAGADGRLVSCASACALPFGNAQHTHTHDCALCRSVPHSFDESSHPIVSLARGVSGESHGRADRRVSGDDSRLRGVRGARARCMG